MIFCKKSVNIQKISIMSQDGSDIDLNCVKMAAVNLLMNTIPGEVAWMDALTLEYWRSYKIELVSVCVV